MTTLPIKFSPAYLMDLPLFNGPDYRPKADNTRLVGQMERIRTLMADGQWRTLAEISRETGAPEASASAMLRHLRKPRFGSHVVEKRNCGGGLFEYRMRS